MLSMEKDQIFHAIHHHFLITIFITLNATNTFATLLFSRFRTFQPMCKKILLWKMK